MRAARASATAVASGTPMPSTSRCAGGARPAPDEHAGGAGAHEVRARPGSYVHPPTITGSSKRRMNVLRLSGSAVRATCSADTTAPWMTSRSGSARSMCVGQLERALRRHGHGAR